LGEKNDMAADGTTKTSISQTIVLFILPAAVLGFVAVGLFFDFLGMQASEIAKLINEIEISCKADLLGALGLMPPADPGVASTLVSCTQYFPKMALFFVALAIWLYVANAVTLKLFENVHSLTLRFAIAETVAVLLPAILLYKYWTVIGAHPGGGGLYIFTAAVAIETIVLQALFAYRLFNFPERTKSSRLIGAIFVISIVAFVILSLLFAYYPENLFNYVGSTNTIVLYAMLAYAFLGGLFFYGRQTGVPFAGILLIWVVVIDALGVTHGNTVPARPVASGPVKGDQQFLSWLAARRDRAAFGAKEYPVYIVASAGGGIYAGMRSAYFLDYLQKKCPSFAHHVFAISGVSGGGLGALAFASQQEGLEQRGLLPCEPAGEVEPFANPQPTPILDDFFSKDLLSTIVGAGLFPNMLQRVIPWPIPSFDRAQAFRKALGENWRDALRTTARQAPGALKTSAPQGNCSTQNYFVACEIASYWNPAGDVPMLIFNATEVDTGAPVALSNIDPLYYANSLASRGSPSFEDRSISLVESASLSARFPIALPAGFLDGFGPKSIRVVDGGYFDGSGLTIAAAVKVAVDEIARAQNLPVKVRVIYLGETVASVFNLVASNMQAGPAANASGTQAFRGAEITAHIKALLQARDQQAAETVRQVFLADTSALRFQWVLPFADKTDTPCSNIPLAWYLAPCTLRVLKVKLQNALENSESFETLRTDLSPQ
jgi:hypothetical protein